jgi:predicted dehydrogenase
VAFVTMEFASGVIANVELSWLAPSKLRRTVIVGSKKMVLYEDGSPEAMKIYDHGVVYEDPESFGEYQLSYRTGDIVTPKLASYEPLLSQVGDFVRAMRTGVSSEQSLVLAYDVVRLAEAAAASLEDGGTQMELDRGELVRSKG